MEKMNSSLREIVEKNAQVFVDVVSHYQRGMGKLLKELLNSCLFLKTPLFRNDLEKRTKILRDVTDMYNFQKPDCSWV